MKRRFVRAIAVTLTVALVAGAFSACSKKKSKTIEEAVDDFAGDAEEYSLDDLKGTQPDSEMIANGVLIITNGEELSENEEITGMLDSLTSDFGISLADMIDLTTMETVKIAVRGNLNTEDTKLSDVAVVGCVVFGSDEEAVKFFDDIDSLVRMGMAVSGVDMDDFNEDDYSYDDDKGEARITLNITLQEVSDAILEYVADMFGDAVTESASASYSDVKGSLVIALRLEGDSIIFSIALGDESIAAADDVYDAAGLDKPSEVESSAEFKNVITDLLSGLIANYLFRAFSLMSDM